MADNTESDHLILNQDRVRPAIRIQLRPNNYSHLNFDTPTYDGTPSNDNGVINRKKYKVDIDSIHKAFYCRYSSLFLWIFLVILNVLCIFLCIIYSVGQLQELTLNDFFCNPILINDIYNINKILGYKYGNLMNTCQRSKGIIVDNDLLFKPDAYTVSYNDASKFRVASCVLFGLSGLVFVLILILGIVTRIKDTVYFCRKKWDKFEYTDGCCECSCLDKYSKCSQCVELGRKLLEILKPDGIGWILMAMIMESIEIGTQTVSFLQYNGQQIFNNTDNGIYLSEKPEYIIYFVTILCCNSILVGILWLMYALCNNKCHGYRFEHKMFVFDGIMDILYASFPLALVIGTVNLKETPASLSFNTDVFDVRLFTTLIPLILLAKKIYTGNSEIHDIFQDKINLKLLHNNKGQTQDDSKRCINRGMHVNIHLNNFNQTI